MVWGRFVQNVAAKFAFFPPDPPCYELREHVDGSGLYLEPLISEARKVRRCEVFKLKTDKQSRGGGGETIVCVWVPFKSTRATILYSHGNAVDLALMLPFFQDLSNILRVNVMGYDYAGYGKSTGKPSVWNTLADIEAVYSCLQEKYGKAPQDILLYGQSVGSGPSTYLAAHNPHVAGLVLHSPLLSGIRVLNPKIQKWPTWADVYPNKDLITKVESKTLIMHGTDDEVIDVSHGQTLHSLAKNPYTPLWADGYNHQNLELCPDFIPRLQMFIADVFSSQ